MIFPKGFTEDICFSIFSIEIFFSIASCSIFFSIASVFVRPGCTAETLIPYCPNSFARFLVIETTAVFLILPTVEPTLRDPNPPILIILPHFLVFM